VELIGWLGSILMGGCGIPQAWESLQKGHSDGLTHLFLWMWAIGEVLMLAYVLSFNTASWPLIANYIVNLALLAIMMKYKYWPRVSKRTFPSMADRAKHLYE
jgi:uncharacterized protein with PQ loop repeat